MDLFGGTIKTLEHSLDYSSAKNRVISSNVANVDTPNYKAKDITFNNVLQDAMETPLEAKMTNPRHIQFNHTTTSYNVVTKNDTTYNHNGNNVDVDKEMSELAQNQIYYNAVIDRINGKFGSLQTVLRGGK